MRKTMVIVLVLGFVVSLATPSSAQLIRRRTKAAQPPATVTPAQTQVVSQVTTETVTTSYMEVTGMVLKIDKKVSQISIRDDNDNSIKVFLVADPRTLNELTPYKRVVISFIKGSNVASSVKILK